MSDKPVLTEAQVREVTAAVAAAEKRTSGEIVPVILGRSDSYPAARWRFAIAFAGLAAFALVMAEPELHPIWYLWAQVPALALGYALGSVAGLQRAFLARAEMDEEVRQRALEAFHLHELRMTRERTSVLILISLLEHRVQILADSGISSKVPQEAWDQIVSRLVGRLRSGEMSAGLCAAITECGELLAREFPRGADDRNELPDHPRLGG
jgi:putative membrane protein